MCCNATRVLQKLLSLALCSLQSHLCRQVVITARRLQEVSAKERALAERAAALRAAEADAEFARSEAEALIAAQKVR